MSRSPLPTISHHTIPPEKFTSAVQSTTQSIHIAPLLLQAHPPFQSAAPLHFQTNLRPPGPRYPGRHPWHLQQIRDAETVQRRYRRQRQGALRVESPTINVQWRSSRTASSHDSHCIQRCISLIKMVPQQFAWNSRGLWSSISSTKNCTFHVCQPHIRCQNARQFFSLWVSYIHFHH